MPNVKFEIEGDASSLLREDNRVITSQEDMERSFRATVSTAQVASEEIAAAIKTTAEAYDLADKSAVRFNRTVSTRSRPQAIQLAPIPGPASMSTTIAATSGQFQLADEARASEDLAAQARLFGFQQRMSQVRDDAGAEKLANWARAQDEIPRVMEELQTERATALEQQGERDLELFRNRMAKQRDAKENRDASISQGIVGVGTAAAIGTAAFSQFAEKYDQAIENVGRANQQFEQTLTPLLSLGDNLSNSARIKDEVLAFSTALGSDPQKIADALFMLQSNASNFSEDVRQKILAAAVGFNRVAGGDIQTDVVAITKLMQNYGGQVGTPGAAAGKLLKTEELAAITPDELGSLLPDVLPAAKLMGHTYDDVAASIITATQAMGSNEKTLTALRNLYLHMPEAISAGLVHQGEFVKQLAELRGVDPMVLTKIFGERTVSVVSLLADKSAEVAKNIKAISAAGESDIKIKFTASYSDPQRADAATRSALDATLANVGITRAQDGSLRKQDLDLQLARIGQKLYADPTIEALTPDIAHRLREFAGAHPDLADPLGIGRKLGIGLAADDQVDKQKGLEKVLDNLRKAGKSDPQSLIEANKLQLEYGDMTNTQIGGRNTGEADAKNYLDLLKTHPNLGIKSFLDYESELSSNPQAAAKLLASIDKAKPKLAATFQPTNAASVTAPQLDPGLDFWQMANPGAKPPNSSGPSGSGSDPASKLSDAVDRFGEHVNTLGAALQPNGQAGAQNGAALGNPPPVAWGSLVPAGTYNGITVYKKRPPGRG